jgi:SAM-dependent methyltransferase
MMSRSELCHDQAMKRAESDADVYNVFRSGQFGQIMAAADRYGVGIQDRVILDFGCSCGVITRNYLDQGARFAIGVDIDDEAIASANKTFGGERLRFLRSQRDTIPLDDASVDTIISYDVFEHVSRPELIVEEFYRILRDDGRVLIGTWGWYHPFAPHLFRAMPVPWAHCVFSERTILRVCRRVYDASWYQPTFHDLDSDGRKRPNRFVTEQISSEYLNKLLIRDFERIFHSSKFQCTIHPISFSSNWARWTRVFLRVPWLREYVTTYFWTVLHKRPTTAVNGPSSP